MRIFTVSSMNHLYKRAFRSERRESMSSTFPSNFYQAAQCCCAEQTPEELQYLDHTRVWQCLSRLSFYI